MRAPRPLPRAVFAIALRLPDAFAQRKWQRGCLHPFAFEIERRLSLLAVADKRFRSWTLSVELKVECLLLWPDPSVALPVLGCSRLPAFDFLFAQLCLSVRLSDKLRFYSLIFFSFLNSPFNFFHLVSWQAADCEAQLIGRTCHDIPGTIAFLLRLAVELTDSAVQRRP